MYHSVGQFVEAMANDTESLTQDPVGSMEAVMDNLWFDFKMQALL